MIIIKKTASNIFIPVTFIILLISTSNVYADEKTRPMDGFFLGAQGEYAILSMSGDYELVPPTQTNDKTSVKWDSQEIGIGLFGGWGHYFDDFFLGIESQYSFYPDAINDTVRRTGKNGTPMKFEINNDFKIQLAGMAGKGISQNSLLYVKLGLVYTDIEVVASSLVTIDGQTGIGAGSVHDWMGGVAGFGLAYNLFDHLALRAEYNFTTYFSGPKYDNDKYDGEKTDYTYYDNRLSIGLVYTF